MIHDIGEVITYIILIIALLFIALLVLFSVLRAIRKKEVFVNAWINEFAYLFGNRTNPKERILKKDRPFYYYTTLLIRILIIIVSIYLAIVLIKRFS